MIPDLPQYNLMTLYPISYILVLALSSLFLGVASVRPKVFTEKRVYLFSLTSLFLSLVSLFATGPETSLDLLRVL